jgi:hypothetical protein
MLALSMVCLTIISVPEAKYFGLRNMFHHNLYSVYNVMHFCNLPHFGQNFSITLSRVSYIRILHSSTQNYIWNCCKFMSHPVSSFRISFFYEFIPKVCILNTSLQTAFYASFIRPLKYSTKKAVSSYNITLVAHLRRKLTKTAFLIRVEFHGVT